MAQSIQRTVELIGLDARPRALANRHAWSGCRVPIDRC
jgi:hypothetical protein